MYNPKVSIIFAIITNQSAYTMFEFDQYLGFLAFLTILTIGFWLMIFLLTFVIPYWIFGASIERMKEMRAERKAKRQAESH